MELHRFRPADWLTAEELANVVDAEVGMRLPRRWYRAWRTYSAARAAWCEQRGLKPYEIRRFIPAPVLDHQSPGGPRV
ncbi:hypothetical protein ABGB17_20315 [Sphaerisporangium sp. B11E5]|uniref:hypothetical protein n=1 Tax=Sphaerisporangium sp. B11E5 TaxID=3153563 RepID=UPI00325CAF76